jgi:hypothetical protein
MEPKANLVSSPASGEARLADLVDAIRAGDPGAVQELYQILQPGVRFLIQRRIGRGNVDEHARSVLAAAVSTIREDADARATAGSIVRLVRQLILRQFPAGPRAVPAARGTPGTVVKAAERILRGMSNVERDALRRCYVLGEAPESFLADLKLTRDQFRALQSRARSEFSLTRSPPANVA